MQVKNLVNCLEVREKESKEEGSFYYSNTFMLDGHKFYLSTNDPFYESGKQYILTGEVAVSGIKVFLNVTPSKMEQINIEQLRMI